MSTFRIPADQIPANAPAAFVPPQFPGGTDPMAAAPAPGAQPQKCGLAIGDYGSSWNRGVQCMAYLPGDKTQFIALDKAGCSTLPEPAGGKDESYSYTVGGCDGGWEVGAWGARTPAPAPARLSLNRTAPRSMVGAAPKHFR